MNKKIPEKNFAKIINCKCGRTIFEEYPSMKKNPPEAPSWEEFKMIEEKCIEKYTRHQNNDCYAMQNDRPFPTFRLTREEAEKNREERKLELLRWWREIKQDALKGKISKMELEEMEKAMKAATSLE